MLDLEKVPKAKREPYDPPRNGIYDAGVAERSRKGMEGYEAAVAARKRKLFGKMLKQLPSTGAVVVEVGMGVYTNAIYMSRPDGPTNMDIIGVDPNYFVKAYAEAYGRSTGLLAKEKGNSLRVARGVAEALPVASGVADAVVSTLTLCTVLSPEQALAEVQRVLKPGGKFLFWEHVLSETDPKVAAVQRETTPEHMERADGCRLDRRTLQTIRNSGFQSVDGEYFELEGFGLLNPTIQGIAVA